LSGEERGEKLAHVTDVMRERFEDDCLFCAASRADNQELEFYNRKEKKCSEIAFICSLMQKP